MDAPDPAPEPTAESATAGSTPDTAGADQAPAPVAEDLPGGSAAALRARQRRWLLERDRFDRAEAESTASPAASGPG